MSPPMSSSVEHEQDGDERGAQLDDEDDRVPDDLARIELAERVGDRGAEQVGIEDATAPRRFARRGAQLAFRPLCPRGVAARCR